MKTSLPISILLSLLTIVGLWLWRTKDMDFMTPKIPSPVTITQPTKPVQAPPTPKAQDTPEEEPILIKTNPLEIKINSEADVAPSLNAYQDFAQQNPSHLLLELATLLDKKGQNQRALLAYERLVDSSSPTPEELTLATTAILRLQPITPAWNLDPELANKLTVNVSTAILKLPKIRTTLQHTAETILKDSGQLVTLTSNLTGPKDSAESSKTLVIALSSPGGHSRTPNFSITPTGSTSADINQSLLTGLYRVIQEQLSQTTSLRIPDAPENVTNHELLYQTQITRLAWKELVDSLPQKE